VKIFLVLFSILLLGSNVKGADSKEIDWERFSSLLVLHEGRVKPIDSVARNALLIIYGKQSFGSYSPVEWLARALFTSESMAEEKVFRVDNPDILGLIGKRSFDGKYYSYQELYPHLEEVDRLAVKALQKEAGARSPFEKGVIQFRDQVLLYWLISNSIQPVDSMGLEEEVEVYKLVGLRLKATPVSSDDLEHLKQFKERYQLLNQMAHFFIIPKEGGKWASMGEELFNLDQTETLSSIGSGWIELASSFQKGDATRFNFMTSQINEELLFNLDKKTRDKGAIEVIFNKVQPFYYSMVLYVIVFLLGIISWVVWGKLLRRVAFGILSFTFLVHTLGLIARIYINGRPPVTSLYTSAVFVGWAAVLICLVLEWKQKNTIGLIVASIIGFGTQLVAHHLAQSGDTLEVMRAVLDSNFWLATHVVVITIGYSSTYVGGMIANLYLVRRIFSKSWSKSETRTLASTVYGITCFSLLMSFVGTVLGGIWADQSWGRFWGWDPKENGALLIVLWCAMTLHLRLGRLVTYHGFMIFSALGTIITTLSWFGVNLLGVGLHSYGFTDGTFLWLAAFVFAQLIIVAVASAVVRGQEERT